MLDGTYNDPAYATAPVDKADLKITFDALTSAATAAVDGGKAQTVARDKCRMDAILQLRLLSHYVESACNNDMPTFVSSGFIAAYTGRTPSQPVAQSAILSVKQGNTGQFVVKLKHVARARHYELRYQQCRPQAPVPITRQTW